MTTKTEQSRSVAMLSGIEDAMRVNSFAIALESCDRIRPQDIPNLLLAYVETMPKATPWRIGSAGGDHDAGDDIFETTYEPVEEYPKIRGMRQWQYEVVEQVPLEEVLENLRRLLAHVEQLDRRNPVADALEEENA